LKELLQFSTMTSVSDGTAVVVKTVLFCFR